MDENVFRRQRSARMGLLQPNHAGAWRGQEVVRSCSKAKVWHNRVTCKEHVVECLVCAWEGGCRSTYFTAVLTSHWCRKLLQSSGSNRPIVSIARNLDSATKQGHIKKWRRKQALSTTTIYFRDRSHLYTETTTCTAMSTVRIHLHDGFKTI